MNILTTIAQKSGWTKEHDAYLESNPGLFTDFFNNLVSAMIGLIDSFFKKTTQIVLEKTTDEFNVKRDLKKFLATKAEGGKLDWLDDDIAGWFGDITVKGRGEKVVSFVYRFLKNLTHRQIIDTSEKFKIYKRYNLLDACEFASKLIDTGEIEKNGRGVVIYLEEERDGKLCRLYVYRDDDGLLKASVLKVIFDFEFFADNGALCS